MSGIPPLFHTFKDTYEKSPAAASSRSGHSSRGHCRQLAILALCHSARRGIRIAPRRTIVHRALDREEHRDALVGMALGKFIQEGGGGSKPNQCRQACDG